MQENNTMLSAAFEALAAASQQANARNQPTLRESGWVRVPESALHTALSVCKGSYQESLIRGYEAWSGSTLKGKAATYKGKYHTSRLALMGRMRAAGLTVSESYEGPRKIVTITKAPSL